MKKKHIEKALNLLAVSSAAESSSWCSHGCLSRATKRVNAWLGTCWCVLLLIALLSAPGILADDLGIGDDDDDLMSLLSDKPKLTPEQINAEVDKAMKTTSLTEKPKALLKALQALLDAGEPVMEPRKLDLFLNDVIRNVSAKQLKPVVTDLLKLSGKDNLSSDPTAVMKLNIGLRLMLVADKPDYPKIKKVYDACRTQMDLKWLLPLLGKSGGKKALPLIKPHLSKTPLIRIGHWSNIRAVPTAAVYGAAYAGDKKAFQQVLDWYETDINDLPRQSFNVAWAIGEGMKPNYQVVDFLNYRILMAEILIQSLEKEQRIALIKKACSEGSLSLTTFFMKSLAKAPEDEIPIYLELLNHPSLIVKQQVWDILKRNGKIDQAVVSKVNGMKDAPRSMDRLFAVETLCNRTPEKRESLLKAAIAQEKNPALKHRFVRMLNENAYY